MSTVIRRAIAASIPAVLVAGSSLAASAAPSQIQVGHAGPRPFVGARPFGVRPAASSTLYAGGATLPGIAYTGNIALGSGGASMGMPGSVFGYLATLPNGAPVSYCETGSGAGKKVLAGPAGTVSNPCANAASGATGPIGFNPGTTALPVAYPNFAGSDSPISQGDYSMFLMNAGNRVEPTEIPSIVGSVGIYINDPDLSGVQPRVTTDQLCAVITSANPNFSQLGLPSRPLKLVYRSDGSGTTFAFSNHLSAAPSAHCRPSNRITASQQFVTVPASAGTVVQTAPNGSIGVKGNKAVAQTVAANPGSLGYVEAANAVAQGLVGPKELAIVDGKDAIKNLPQAANAIPANIAVDSTVATGVSGPAQVVKLTGVPKAGCIQLLNPLAYATPTAGYPIVAVTNLDFNEAGNNANLPGSVTSLRTLVNVLASPSSFGAGKITTVDPASATTGTKGYSELSPAFTSVLNNTAATCIN